MYFLGLGLVLLLAKWLEYGPVAGWSWLWVLLPFFLTAAWWSWADYSGYSKRKAMEREDKRRDDRRARTKQALDATYHNRPR